MKNDFEKIKDITGEMVINDMIYQKMQYDLEIVKECLLGTSVRDTEIDEFYLDEIYFFKRVLSVLANEDIPSRAGLGLFVLDDILSALYDEKEDYIGESDSDSDIYKYVIEYGYRNFDRSFGNNCDEFKKLFRNALKKYNDLFRMDGETDENE